MQRLDPLDSKNTIERALERWKRGLGVLAFVAIAGLPALLAWAIAYAADHYFPILGGWGALAVAAVPALVWPWCIGDRKLLRDLGAIAKQPDHPVD